MSGRSVVSCEPATLDHLTRGDITMLTKTLAAAAFLAALGLIGFFAMPAATTVVAAEASDGCACICCETCATCTADCSETCACALCHVAKPCFDEEATPAPKPDSAPGGCCG